MSNCNIWVVSRIIIIIKIYKAHNCTNKNAIHMKYHIPFIDIIQFYNL